jgi:hypothetical protein
VSGAAGTPARPGATATRSNAGILGLLMLDTAFPRVPGDVGHVASWQMPLLVATVTGASPQRVVQQGDPALLQPFIDAARDLVARGATAITTSCGFLVQVQSALQAALPVPVWTSSLLLLPTLERPGVVTVDAASLAPLHLLAAGADATIPIEGLEPGCSLQNTLLQNQLVLDARAAEADVVAAALRLVQRHPEVAHLVLECTNMPPYAAAVQAATGRPVHHLVSMVHARWAALRPARDQP